MKTIRIMYAIFTVAVSIMAAGKAVGAHEEIAIEETAQIAQETVQTVQIQEEIKKEQTEEQQEEQVKEQEDRTAADDYMLAKIAMAEAEGESLKTKALVIRTVLNRVKSPNFPDNVEEVIYQKNQFTPISDGRYDRVEPNEECYEALKLVKEGWDESEGATYFEMTQDHPTWHSDNLLHLFEIDGTSFYKEYDR